MDFTAELKKLVERKALEILLDAPVIGTIIARQATLEVRQDAILNIVRNLSAVTQNTVQDLSTIVQAVQKSTGTVSKLGELPSIKPPPPRTDN